MKPNRRILSVFAIFTFAAFCVCAHSALAQGGAAMDGDKAAAEGEKPKEKTKLEPGVIASFGEYQGEATVDVNTSLEVLGDEASPIQASVQRLGGDRCKAILANASKKDSWSVRYRIIGTRGGRRVVSKSFSGRFRPGEEKTHELRCDKDVNMAVEIRGGKKAS